MHTSHIRKIIAGLVLMGVLLSLLTTGGSPIVHAQDVATPQPKEQRIIQRFPLQDEKLVEEHSIIGSPEPPPGFEKDRKPVVLPKTSNSTIEAISLPGSKWLYGCSAGAAEEIAAGYDQATPYCVGGLKAVNDLAGVQGLYCQVTGLINVYNGPTDGGVMPFDNSAWPTWTDIAGDTYPNNPLIASHQFVDGRTTRGTIDDYWVSYNSSSPDPYITGGWTEHEWGDAIGDYMFTSQSKYGNVDGQTKFYIYANSPDPLTSDDAAQQQLPDGTLGMKNFYEARGYAVDVAYNQPTSNAIAGGFTFAQYKAEIDAGRPVMIHLENTPQGHTIVGIGYDSATNEVLLHDGWDDLTHKMPWGGSYAGMVMKMVSIIHPVPVDITKYTISGYAGTPNVTINYTGGSTTSLANGYYSFAVSPGWSGTVTPSKTGYIFSPASRQYNNVSGFQMKQSFTSAPVTLQDPGFELGYPNPYWQGISTNFETPLCTLNTCLSGTPASNAAPRTGSGWSWFGGTSADEVATLSQNVTIPNSKTVNLKFYLWIGSADPGSDSLDMFTVKLDSTVVFSANATQISTYSDYTLVNIDISGFADGGSHSITFSSETTAQQVDFNLDDVVLVGTSFSSSPGSFTKSSPLNNTTGQSSNLTLSWGESSGAASYAYCFDTTNDNACSSWISVGNNTFANLSGLIPNTVYYWQVSASNMHGTTYADGSSASYWSFTTFVELTTSAIRSVGTYDGWILESAEFSVVGGAMDSAANTIMLGDDAADRQYRAVLHFDTSVLPDTAVVTSAVLQIKRHSIVGSDPITILGTLRADLHKVSFGISALQLSDFKSAASKNNVAKFSTTPVNNWYSGVLTPIGRAFINRTGTTQFKLYFILDDNDDLGADFIRIFSGNAGASSRPKLIIQYYVPN